MRGNQDINDRLTRAVRHGKLEVARKLINSYGLSFAEPWSKGYVLLCDALKFRHSDIAKLLLTSGSEVNSNNNVETKVKTKHRNYSNTPLHIAAINGDIEIIKMLLARGADINAKNCFGQTPLYDAIENDQVEITELLLKHEAYVNASNNNFQSPLQVAMQKGNLQTVEVLLKNGANINCVSPVYTSRCVHNYTPLHFAVEKGSLEVTTLLLSRGANVDVGAEDGVTPLHIAAKKGYLDIAEDLLNHGACINSLTFMDKYTPLYVAVKEEHKTVIRLLLRHGAKVDHQDTDGKTILHLAVEKGHLMIVEDVLKYYPDINNQSNRSSLYTAVYSNGEGFKEIVEALLDYGLTVNPEDANNPILLHIAIEKGYLKIVSDLLKYGADVNTLHGFSFFEPLSPLNRAIKHKQEEVVKLLMSYKADINVQDKNGKTPIFYAIENADLKIMKLLLTNGANVKDSPELLNIAVKKGYIGIVEVLLQHNADVNASDVDGNTALHLTAIGDLRSHISRPNVNIKGEIAKLLLNQGSHVDAQNKDGMTALHFTTRNRYAQVVEVLLDYNANVNLREKSDNITPLHTSALRGDEEICKMLLNRGADIDAQEEDGYTALHIATEEDHKEIVKLLLERGAKVDSKSKSDITPLYLGAQRGYQEIIETILKFGADINSRDKDGRTALHIASHNGHIEVVTTLLEYGSDINIMNRDYYTPLRYAIVEFFTTGLNFAAKTKTVELLERHTVKMKTANLYVNENNFLSGDKLRNFKDKCEEEIISMKSVKINNYNVSFYDILTKSINSLAICLRNEDIVQILKLDDYKTKFPIYASMIKSRFRNGMKRKVLLEQGNKILLPLFTNCLQSPQDCIEKIFSYLSDEDLKNFNECL